MDSGGPARRPVRKETVDFRVLDDLSSVAVDSGSGEAHALNPVATAVLERCDGTMTVEAIVAEVVEIFDAPAPQIEADIASFLDELAAKGLIEW
jgi:coenzyme PQQ biosynthesis protein PqqD